jgi:hypothetical protein
MKMPDRHLKKKIRDKFINLTEYLKNTLDIRWLIAMPSLLGLLLGLLWINIGKQIYGTLPRIPNLIMGSIGFFLMGFSGIVIMIKREIPGTFKSIRGIPALVIGVSVTIFLWGMAFMIIYRIIFGY